MVLLWWLGAAMASPSVEIELEAVKGQQVLRVMAPEGQHVAEEALYSLSLHCAGTPVHMSGPSEDVVAGIVLEGVGRGEQCRGELSVPICEDAGDTCELQELVFTGETPRRGLARWTAADRYVPQGLDFPAQVDAVDLYAKAAARAARNHKPVLVDFSAVWCPPCNLLAKELLSQDVGVLKEVELVEVDADDASSWPLKSAYEVTGYPTILALDAHGNEIGRIVGYPGREETEAWMWDMVQLYKTGAVLGPEAMAEEAWRLVQREKLTDAQALLDEIDAEIEPEESLAQVEKAWEDIIEGKVKGEEAEEALPELQADLAVRDAGTRRTARDTVPYRLARMHLNPTIEDGVWLLGHAPEKVLQWVDATESLGEDGKRLAVAALREGITRVDGPQCADMLYVLADYLHKNDAVWAYSAAAALIRSEMEHEPTRAKGYIAWYATLLEMAGDKGMANDVLRQAIVDHPNEPTFYWKQAQLLLRGGAGDLALDASLKAVQRAWGDNLLMVGRTHAEILMALGKTEEAVEFVNGVLEEVEAPEEDQDVRSHRLREELAEVVAEVSQEG